MVDAGTPRLVKLVLAVLGAWFLADLALTLANGPGDTPRAQRLVYDAMLVVAAAVAAARRGPWTAIGAGMAAWAVGDGVLTVKYWTADEVPVPSAADAGYLLLPPLVALGFLRLLRQQRPLSAARLADGATAALSIAAVGAALVWRPVREAASGEPLAVATNLAYPLGDLALLGVCVGALASRGFSLDRAWVLSGLGVLAFWLADSLYLVHTARGDYAMGSWFDTGWSLGIVLLAVAAWQPAPGPAGDEDRLRSVLGPLGFAAIALGLLAIAGLQGYDALAVGLATVAVVATFARLLVAFREHQRMLGHSRVEAVTDALTGLGNRRGLTQALERAVAVRAEASVLVLADLDGFKGYNDSFGHPAGDQLLSRLGGRLATAVDGRGEAFRMGGDEFCVLLPARSVDGPDAAGALVREALTEQGDGFRVGCSVGVVAVPDEASEPEEVLRLADRRLYAAKHQGRASAGNQSKDVLLRALVERSPDLVSHATDVAARAVAVGRRLGLTESGLVDLGQAAELHDVGKVAIPDAMLSKPGPLDEVEWAFMRQHTIIGERILLAAPALSRVAALVRSSHERWDGDGYPDRLAAGDIPLGARIIAVADAYDAMVADRPYEAARSHDEAITELRRCAGSQFDPAVVAAFCAEIDAERRRDPRDDAVPEPA